MSGLVSESGAPSRIRRLDDVNSDARPRKRANLWGNNAGNANEQPAATAGFQASERPFPFQRDDVEVAIICALPLEYDAVSLLLDKSWDYGGDFGNYKAGCIGALNVILALLPGMGKANAASTAADLRANYRRIRLVFVAGICGGVPISNDREILLGDVIISNAIVQYDFGRQYPDKFEFKTGSEDHMSKPDKDCRIMLNKLGTMEGQRRLHRETSRYLRLLQSYAYQQDYEIQYRYPGVAEDKLFRPEYLHKHRKTTLNATCDICEDKDDQICEGASKLTCDHLECDERYLLPRKRISTKLDSANQAIQDPAVHIGVVGSGDMVIKSGEHRDKIASRNGIVAFEMEGAGVAVEIPCVVVKGVCDYADCHKNKKWQNFAAATAASALKFLTEEYKSVTKDHQHPVNASSPPSKTTGHSISNQYTIGQGNIHDRPLQSSAYSDDESCPTGQLLTRNGVKGLEPLEVGTPSNDMSRHGTAQQMSQFDENIELIEEYLCFDQIDARLESLQNANLRTCDWFFSQPYYLEWIDKTQHPKHHGLLWIKGKPGAGKSVLVKHLFSQARDEARINPGLVVISFFFNARGEKLERTTLGAYRSILWQLCTMLRKQYRIELLQHYLDSRGPATTRRILNQGWRIETLKDALNEAVLFTGERELRIYIDALDECSNDDVADMISFFEDMAERASGSDKHLKILFSSRHYPTITIQHGIEVTLEDQIEHASGMSQYISSKLNLQLSRGSEDLGKQILENSKGVFLWVVLVVKILNEACAKGRVDKYKQCFEGIPAGLESVFDVILEDDSDDIDHLRLCIQWILFAPRPMTPVEFWIAICGEEAAGSWIGNLPSNQDLQRFVQNSSKGLAEIAYKDWSVQFVHESIRDYFRLEKGIRKLWSDDYKTFRALSEEALRDRCAQAIKSGKHNDFSNYANQYILKHANNAQRLGRSQKEFLSTPHIQDLFQPRSSLGSRFAVNDHFFTFIDEDLLYLIRGDLESVDFWDRILTPFIYALTRGTIAAARELVRRVIPSDSDLSEFEARFDAFLRTGSSHYGTDFLCLLIQLDYEPILKSYLEWRRMDASKRSVRSLELDRPIMASFKRKAPLELARSEEIQALLVSYGANIEPLRHRLTIHGTNSPVLLRALHAIGADLNARDPFGCTALYTAQTVEKTQFLLDNGAESMRLATSMSGQTALHRQAKLGNVEMLECLLSSDMADINWKDQAGNTPLHIAVHEDQTAIVVCLVSRPSLNLDSTDKRGRSPIFYCNERVPQVCTALLTRDDLDMNLGDLNGRTALSFHVEKGHIQTVRAILATGRCHLGLIDKQGGNLLHWTAAGLDDIAQVSILTLLLQSGIFDPLQYDSYGRTPKEIAEERGLYFLAICLKRYEEGDREPWKLLENDGAEVS